MTQFRVTIPSGCGQPDRSHNPGNATAPNGVPKVGANFGCYGRKGGTHT